MKRLPPDYRLGAKERSYLVRLEEFRRQGVPLTPSDFCQRVGLKGTSSITGYKFLKRALNEYGWATQPHRMRGKPPSVHDAVDLAPDPRLRRLERKVERLTRENEKLASLRNELRDRENELDSLRGILVAMVTHFAAGDYRRAQDIEHRLLQVMREHIGAANSDLDALLDEIQRDW